MFRMEDSLGRLPLIIQDGDVMHFRFNIQPNNAKLFQILFHRDN